MQYFVIQSDPDFPDKLIGPMSDEKAEGFKQGWDEHPDQSGGPGMGPIERGGTVELIGPLNADEVEGELSGVSSDTTGYRIDGGAFVMDEQAERTIVSGE